MIQLSLEETIETVDKCLSCVQCPVEAAIEKDEYEGCYLYGHSDCVSLLRDRVIALLKEQEETIYGLQVDLASANEITEGYVELLKDQPDVVRCGDCKWYRSTFRVCDNPDRSCNGPGWFCADGRRKDD